MISKRLFVFLFFLSFINIGITNSILVFWKVDSTEGSWLIWVYPFMTLFYYLGSFCGLGLCKILSIDDCLKTSMLGVIVACVLTALSPDILSISASLVVFLGVACGMLSFFVILEVTQQNHSSLIYALLLSGSTVSSVIIPELSSLIMTFAHWRIILLILALSLSIGLLFDHPAVSYDGIHIHKSLELRSSVFLVVAHSLMALASTIPTFVGFLPVIMTMDVEWKIVTYISAMTALKIPLMMGAAFLLDKNYISPLYMSLFSSLASILGFLGYTMMPLNITTLAISNIIYQISSASISVLECSIIKIICSDSRMGICVMQAIEGIGSFIGTVMVLLMIGVNGLETVGLLISIIATTFIITSIKYNSSISLLTEEVGEELI